MRLGQATIALHPHGEVWLLCVALVAVYVGLIHRYGGLMHPRPDDPAVTGRQKLAFGLGVAALWVASGSPLHDLAEHYLYSAHMVQHLLQAFVVPPLLLLGIPTWMGEMLLRPRWLQRAVAALSRPLVAALLFNGTLALIHWPDVVDGMLGSEVFHASSHVILIVTATFMWMNVVSPVPHLVPRLNPLPQMIYLFVMTILPTIPATFLTFGEHPLYHAYADLPRVWAGFDALEDMRVAGLIMKIGGGFLLWGIITVMFFRWAADEERSNRPPASPDPTPTRTPSDLPT
ncbi:MAG: cytochrome c oxidase assembly protein [Actinobacteria bacterium]|nr:cytochrome c oxidase assembly protein [Actinomycetota bacterium]